MAQGVFGRLQQELEAREQAAGLTMADVLQLPPAERQLVNWMIRTGEVSAAAVATFLGQAEGAQSLLAALVAKGFIREEQGSGELHYDVRLAPRRQRQLPDNIWQALSNKLGKNTGA